MIVSAIRKRWPWVKHPFGDGAYDRTALLNEAAFRDFVSRLVRRIDRQPGFKPLPKRWLVERTLGWLIRCRRLVRDYEKVSDVAEAMIHVPVGAVLLPRVAHG